MGLLDDAIREHLELKRRRGADPGEVAREQREALDVAAQASEAPQADVAEAPAQDEARPHVPANLTDADADAGRNAPEADRPDEAAALDETAELDMSSVLGEEGSGDASASAPIPGEEDSLEWEVPGEADESESEEAAEDVLEETPEFLRDTPEEDRLWFEQRPPRDFDFDK
jgi:hypothetical protein